MFNLLKQLHNDRAIKGYVIHQLTKSHYLQANHIRQTSNEQHLTETQTCMYSDVTWNASSPA